MSITSVFTGFLSREKVLDKFRNNLQARGDNKTLIGISICSNNSYEQIIKCAFIWEETEEGSYFWFDISQKWKYYLTNINSYH